MTQLDIVIPVYNQAAKTVRLLRSIRETYSDYRIILIDNASEPSEATVVRAELARHERVRLIENDENLGFVKGTNQGIATSTAPFVCLLNNDTVVYPGGLRRLLAHAGGEGVGAVGPVTSDCESWQSRRLLHAAVPDIAISIDEINQDTLARRYDGETWEVGLMLAFFCVLMPRTTIETVGYLDESYKEGMGDDDDYSARIRQAGLKLLLALDVYVHHDHRTTFRSLYSESEIWDMGERGHTILARKFPPPTLNVG